MQMRDMDSRGGQRDGFGNLAERGLRAIVLLVALGSAAILLFGTDPARAQNPLLQALDPTSSLATSEREARAEGGDPMLASESPESVAIGDDRTGSRLH